MTARSKENASPLAATASAVQPAASLRWSVAVLLVVLMGLPAAVWLDLRNISETALRRQVDSFASVVGEFRAYYANNVVARVLAHHGETQAAANFKDIPGAIPIPARMSIDLGQLIGESRANTGLGYRFFSDHAFASRAPHVFDAFEREALAQLRAKATQSVYEVSGSWLDRKMRLITPVVMDAGCVACHNSHAESPRRDWKVGDVRGLEEFTLSQPLAANVFSFGYLLLYFAIVASAGAAFVLFQRRQTAIIRAVNGELGRTNAFLASIAEKLSKYLSPQHYRSIFMGESDAKVSTNRKKLTIFFSDIVDFTAISDDIQPEELTELLNEYLTEMSRIAARHGGTVNKYIGDAMLVFFGDPTTRGASEDARACIAMAFEMQQRLRELNVQWRTRGFERPFRARMGVNTGYCNVGNFGSEDRMDYTIIGGEANLAARLQAMAPPGGVVVSYETFVLVSDQVKGTALDATALKGLARPVAPYLLSSQDAPAGEGETVIAEHVKGLDLLVNLKALEGAERQAVAKILEEALRKVRPEAPSR